MNEYTPPKVWKDDNDNGGEFANINAPTAGARFEKELPRGDHPFQLYSLATPNGVKVTIMFEELLALGIKEAEYDAFPIDITKGQQFSSGFVAINPNSKIPALLDTSGEKPIRLFESGSILYYLAKKFGKFLPKDIQKKTETMSWLFWQVGAGPFVGGGFGHFYSYAPQKIKYAIDRFAMETKRQLDLLDKHLKDNEYIVGSEYTIADMAIWPWYGTFARGELYGAGEFLAVHEYESLNRWANKIKDREPVKRGRLVNKAWGDEDQQLLERHSASDFEGLNLEYK